jgi:hypothetical protein
MTAHQLRARRWPSRTDSGLLAKAVRQGATEHALGRTRGGWTTKLHLAAEQGRKPMAILITAGSAGTDHSSRRSWNASGS